MLKFIFIGLFLLQGSVAAPTIDPQQRQQQTVAQSSPSLGATMNHDERAGGAWVVSLATVIALVIYTVFAGLQWWAIRRQATKMQSQLEEMKHQACVMEKGLKETQHIVDQNERGISTAEKGLELAQNNERRSLRAYVNILAKAEFVQEANPARVRVEIVNFGKTPANSVRFIVKVEVRKIEELPKGPSLNDLPIIGKGAPLAPSMSIVRIEKTSQRITAEQADLIRDGRARLFVWGVVGYKDIFDEERHTSFLCVHNPPNENLEACFLGNEAT